MNVLTQPDATMTPQEAEAIVQRLMERGKVAADGPRVADVAEALGVSPDEVARMLAEVRAKPLARPRRRTSRRERRVWMMSGLVAIALGVVAFATMRNVRASLGFVAPHRLRSLGASGTGAYAVFLDGLPQSSKFVGEQPSLLLNDVAKWIDDATPRRNVQALTLETDKASRIALRMGHWDDVAGVHFETLEIRKGAHDGDWLRWASGTVPTYNGDDALIAEAVREERARRVQEAITAALRGLG